MAINLERYTVNSKTLIGQITPFFLRGKKLLRFLAAISTPLDSVNEAFLTWVRNTLVGAVTTSQVIVLKWSIKSRLKSYMLNVNDEFVFSTYERSNYTTLYENQSEQQNYPEVKQIYMPEDTSDSSVSDDSSKIIIRNREEIASESNEVMVIAPPHNSKISDEEYMRKIRQCIEPYLVYNVEYKIVISRN